jgi:hypothetical protein
MTRSALVAAVILGTAVLAACGGGGTSRGQLPPTAGNVAACTQWLNTAADHGAGAQLPLHDWTRPARGTETPRLQRDLTAWWNASNGTAALHQVVAAGMRVRRDCLPLQGAAVSSP